MGKSTFAVRLETLLAETKMQRKALALSAGISEQAIGYYINDKRKPDYEITGKIANAFGVSVDYLIGLTDIKSPNVEIRKICSYTGLNEKTIAFLHSYTFTDENIIHENIRDEETWIAICEEIKSGKVHKLRFLDAFIQSSEFRYITSYLERLSEEIKRDSYFPNISYGECWSIQNQFNSFIEQYSGLKEAKEQYEQSKEEQ